MKKFKNKRGEHNHAAKIVKRKISISNKNLKTHPKSLVIREKLRLIKENSL
jgi:hypothetical protein